MIEGVINESTIKMRVIERPGPKHQDTMIATNANEKQKCEKINTCLVCNTDKGGDCRKKEVVYEITCKTCKPKMIYGYDGQTGRNAYTRGKEHVDSEKATKPSEQEKSMMWRHQQSVHNGEKAEWEMKVHKAFQKQPLDRLICEARRIRARPPETSLNSKHEFAKSGMIRVAFTSDIKEAKELNEKVKEQVEKALEKLMNHNIPSDKNHPTQPKPPTIDKQSKKHPRLRFRRHSTMIYRG